jgi:hypothetical protein
MAPSIHAADEVRDWLWPLTTAQLRFLAGLAGVSFSWLVKFRLGFIANPGIDTVRAFVPHIEAALSA